MENRSSWWSKINTCLWKGGRECNAFKKILVQTMLVMRVEKYSNRTISSTNKSNLWLGWTWTACSPSRTSDKVWVQNMQARWQTMTTSILWMKTSQRPKQCVKEQGQGSKGNQPQNHLWTHIGKWLITTKTTRTQWSLALFPKTEILNFWVIKPKRKY